jgi:hypothetical protein
MQSSDFIPSSERSLYAQSTLTETQAYSSSSQSAPASAAATQDAALLMIPLCFVAIWAAVVCVISNTWKPGHKEVESSQYTTQLPCKKCRFFNNNPYVKCAVNPHIAMTKAANTCSDFQPKERKSAR